MLPEGALAVLPLFGPLPYRGERINLAQGEDDTFTKALGTFFTLRGSDCGKYGPEELKRFRRQ